MKIYSKALLLSIVWPSIAVLDSAFGAPDAGSVVSQQPASPKAIGPVSKNSKDPQNEVVNGVWDRNAFFKIINRKLLAARTADWNVHIMPYDDLIKLQHVLILLTPFFQTAYADTSEAAFQQSKVRSPVLIEDVRNILSKLLASDTGNLNPNQAKIKEILGCFDGNRSITYAPGAAREDAIEIIKALQKLRISFEGMSLSGNNLKDFPDVPKATNVLSVLHARMRFLEDAANEAVTKRYNPYRKTDKVQPESEISALNRPVDTSGEGDRLEKREERAAALVPWKKARNELRDLQNKLPKISDVKERKQVEKRIGELEKEVERLHTQASDVLGKQAKSTSKGPNQSQKVKQPLKSRSASTPSRQR